mgnify:CR=1 FL=1
MTLSEAERSALRKRLFTLRRLPDQFTDCTLRADLFKVIDKVPSEYRGARPAIDGNYSYGLVMTRTGAKIQLAFRVSRRQTDLMMQPVFVSEVHFQGDPDR